jgi:hypothetical protein
MVWQNTRDWQYSWPNSPKAQPLFLLLSAAKQLGTSTSSSSPRPNLILAGEDKAAAWHLQQVEGTSSNSGQLLGN